MQQSIIDQVIKQGSSTKLNADSNNCTVLALAATLGISYDEAFNLAKDTWRRAPKKGVPLRVLDFHFTSKMGAKKVDTKKVYHTKHNNKNVICKMTVGTFAKEYSSGNYYVVVSGHALAINDGKILDHTNLIPKNKRIVKCAWKIK